MKDSRSHHPAFTSAATRMPSSRSCFVALRSGHPSASRRPAGSSGTAPLRGRSSSRSAASPCVRCRPPCRRAAGRRTGRRGRGHRSGPPPLAAEAGDLEGFHHGLRACGFAPSRRRSRSRCRRCRTGWPSAPGSRRGRPFRRLPAPRGRPSASRTGCARSRPSCPPRSIRRTGSRRSRRARNGSRRSASVRGRSCRARGRRTCRTSPGCRQRRTRHRRS